VQTTPGGGGGRVRLMLKYLSESESDAGGPPGGPREIAVLESEFGHLFTMDWRESVKVGSDEELGRMLQQCLVVVEDSVQRLRWEDVTDAAGGGHRGHGGHAGVTGDVGGGGDAGRVGGGATRHSRDKDVVKSPPQSTTHSPKCSPAGKNCF
jgi:hypothetical protein